MKNKRPHKMIINVDKRQARRKPILRWAGGKSRLVPELARLLPTKWNRYFEPMVGGGALFFFIQPKQSILADINEELINFYSVLRDKSSILIPALIELKASRSLYYELRRSRPDHCIQQAIRFAYLNRLSWNGLFRVNKNGYFNVPIGDRLPQSLWSSQQLEEAAKTLKMATLLHGDVEKILGEVQAGDFVFIDPPYPKGCTDRNWFDRYSASGFTIDDHRRLAEQTKLLDKYGIQVLLTLSESSDILQLYPNHFDRTVVVGNSLISGNGSSRRNVREVVLRNYE